MSEPADHAPMPNDRVGPGYVNFDFLRWFPHLFWVSNWQQDDEYPAGYRYKVLSVQDERESRAEVAVVLELKDGTKSEVARTAGPLHGARSMAMHFTKGLADRFALEFEEQDLSDVRTQVEFDVRATQCGWLLSPGDAPKGRPTKA